MSGGVDGICRQELMQMLGVLSLSPGICLEGVREAPVLNDVHSQLNPTRVTRVVEPPSIAEVQKVIRAARREGRSISVAGGRHAMGGQQLGTDTIHVDTRTMDRLIAFDERTGVLDVEAGIQWPELIAGYLKLQGERARFGIAQKQTGADRLAIGGALSANVHGRGLALSPFVGDVESFTLVDADGEVRNCSRTENADLFSLAIGGYGLFGVIASVRLRLRPRRKLERLVEIRNTDGLADAFEQRTRDGHLYGDFQFDIDECSPTFLTRGVFATYRPLSDDVPVPGVQTELAYDDWMRLLHLAHVDKAHAFDLYSRHYLSTSGQIYWSDTSQLSLYPEGYHLTLDARTGAKARGSEMITEVYVPREELAPFLREAAVELRRARANVIYGTVRMIERDDETFLSWARERYACIVLNLHVDHTPLAIAAAKRAFRMLIDLAERRGGTYYLTYHRWATREQVLRGHPRFAEFLRLKRRYDPESRFQSDWYQHHRALVE